MFTEVGVGLCFEFEMKTKFSVRRIFSSQLIMKKWVAMKKEISVRVEFFFPNFKPEANGKEQIFLIAKSRSYQACCTITLIHDLYS